MPQRKNRFLTILFSLFPGAGHMYLGFMKMGLSLAGAFLLLVFLASWLGMGELMVFAPLLFFYSFFDCIQKCYAGEEEFASYRDRYLFAPEQWKNADQLLRGRGRLVLGLLILTVGVCMVGRLLLGELASRLPAAVYTAVVNAVHALPQFVVGLLIIGAGAYLIAGRRKEENHD